LFPLTPSARRVPHSGRLAIHCGTRRAPRLGPRLTVALIPMEQLGDRGAGFFGHNAESIDR
jgi:hypothetical protein